MHIVPGGIQQREASPNTGLPGDLIADGKTPYDRRQVKSSSAKPRLVGRQPSTRGGVPRVKTRPIAESAMSKRGPPTTDPVRQGATAVCRCRMCSSD